LPENSAADVLPATYPPSSHYPAMAATLNEIASRAPVGGHSKS
jgi:hypothetical protein